MQRPRHLAVAPSPRDAAPSRATLHEVLGEPAGVVDEWFLRLGGLLVVSAVVCALAGVVG